MTTFNLLVIISQPCTDHGFPDIKDESEIGVVRVSDLVSASFSAGYTSFLAAELDITVSTILVFTFFIDFRFETLSQPCTGHVTIVIINVKVFVKDECECCIVFASLCCCKCRNEGDDDGHGKYHCKDATAEIIR